MKILALPIKTNNQLKLILAALMLFYLAKTLNGQIKTHSYEFGFSSITSEGEQMPFWLISNRQGKYLPHKYALSWDFGVHAKPNKGKIFDYGYGLELFGRVSDESFDDMLNRTFGGNGNFWLHQAYVQFVLFDFLQFRGGMWEETLDSRKLNLSSGSIIWSGNARPIPKIEIGSSDYLIIPYTKGFVEMKGLLSHGWFEEGRFANDVWLHHKNIYIRLGGSLPVNFHYGFNHFAQWGGNAPIQQEPFPSDFSTFLRVLLNKKGDPNRQGTPDSWIQNRYGNSLGSRHIELEINLNNIDFGIYQQDIFEDGSGMRRRNFPDGLWGTWISFSEGKKLIQSFIYEYLQTTHQSGPVHVDASGNVLGGNDNYFNHSFYRAGWTYHKYTIGTPLISSPIFNETSPFSLTYLFNNRVLAHHVGFEGYITKTIKYKNIFTYSKNYGTYFKPFEENLEQFSWMFEINAPLNFFDMDAGVIFAADAGKMYGNNFGMFIMFRNTGIFHK